MSYEQNDCDHEQQMDRSERHVECDKSQQPQDEQNSGDSSEHDSSLIRPNFQTVLTIRFEQKIGYRGKPLLGGMACCNYRPYIDLRGLIKGGKTRRSYEGIKPEVVLVPAGESNPRPRDYEYSRLF